MLKIAAFAFLFIATVIILAQFLGNRYSQEAQERLEGKEKKRSRFVLYRLFRPIIEKFFVPSVAGNPRLDEYRRTRGRMLVAAGIENEMSPDEFFAFKIVLAFAIPIIGFAIARLGLPIFFYPLLILLGWFFPDIMLKGLIKRRHKEILIALPFVVDMLTLITEAGLDFMAALQRVVEKARPSPLVEELRLAIQEVQLGSTRADALRKMASRLQMEEISSFIAILGSADQMGSSIGKVLRAQSDALRTDRFIRAEKAGATASQLMLFPLIFLIMPAAFIIVFGPLVVKWISGGFF
ncbi:MAG TPA: type II secretion system F family protein [Bdellovibrionota bacterium]|nr:type II secretion system F family protein [Bdellovibrionota bacterium]